MRGAPTDGVDSAAAQSHTMSPKGLLLLLAVGLCAAQVSSAASPPVPQHALSRARYERGVTELLAAAKVKLINILAAAKDAAGSSIETVWGYVKQLEADALRAGTERLAAQGIQVNLTSVAELLKTNIKACVTDEKITGKAKDIVFEVASCISGDIKSLKKLIKTMQDMWETAKTMPDTMAEVADKCSEHAEHEVEGDALVEFKDEAEAHDLAEKANELLAEASRTLSKRDLWSFGRMTRCVKAVYSLSKSDLVTIPGQIVVAAANGYRIYNSAREGNIKDCVALKATQVMPAVAGLAIELGTCVANMDLDAVVAQYPALAGLKQIADIAQRAASSGGKAPMGMAMSMGMGALPPAARQAMAAAGMGGGVGALVFQK